MTRRDLLRGLLVAIGLPATVARAWPRGRVGIVGGGMAGVSLAWLLDGQRDVVLLEERGSIGGNVQSETVELDGDSFVADLGAQYFHPGPFPLYAALLAHLGLYDPGSPESSRAHAFPASITVFADGEAVPRFVSPVLPGRAWPLLAPWNKAGLEAFAVAFRAAKRRELLRESWTVTLEDWLPTLGLSPEQWEGTLLPWAASLFSGGIEQARGLSARAAMIFAAKALPPNPLEPLLYYVLRSGMIEVLHRLVEQCSTVQFLTGAAVQSVTRERGGFTIRCGDGRLIAVDEVVLAASGPSTSRLLEGLPGTGPQRAALEGIEFHEAHVALHADPVYAPSRPAHRSFLNCRIDGPFCEASMWLAGVLPDLPETTAARMWKSWVAHRAQPPARILRQARFRHMLPTAPTIRAQNALRALQGRGRIWFAGGYTLPYDSQETALRSALRVAIGLQAASSRGDALLNAWEPLED